MSAIGDSINGGLVAVVVVVVAGAVGATLYYQHSVDRLDDRTDALSDHTRTLERDLTATHADLRAAKRRARDLDRNLSVARSDVSTLSERLEESRQRRRAAEAAAWGETERPDAAGGELDAPGQTPVVPTGEAEPDVRDERAWSDAWADEPWNDAPSSSPDESWDDGLVDDGGYGTDTCVSEAESESGADETAGCEG